MDSVIHSRLNYWLVTEGIMFAAFGALWGAAQDSDIAGILFLLSYVGVALTVFWQMLTLRAWVWLDWYYGKFSCANRKRSKDDSCLIPPDKHWSLWSGHGLSMRLGSVIMALVFVVMWVMLGVYALVSLVDPSMMLLGAYVALSVAVLVAVYGLLMLPLYSSG